MTAKDILIKVKALFDAPVAAPVIPVAPVEAAAPPAAPVATPQTYKLKDGTEISIAIADPSVTVEPSIGDMVTIAGAPAPDGELEMEDGSKITVTSGAISDIKAIEPTTQPDFAAPVVPTLEERITAIESKVNASVAPTTYASQFEAQEGKIQKQDAIIKEMFTLIEKLVEMPSADPKTLTGAKKDAFDRVNKKEKALQGIADAITKMKNK